MKDQVINGDTTWHRHVHADLQLPTEWTCTSYQNDELPSFQHNGWIIWIDERKPTKRLSYDEGERYERYLVYNWDHYNGMPDHSLFDEPYLWTNKLSEVKAWVSKRCQNNRYTMEGMEIGYA
jgi:hypothetical protein